LMLDIIEVGVERLVALHTDLGVMPRRKCGTCQVPQSAVQYQ
jgi:hypothetical protein